MSIKKHLSRPTSVLCEGEGIENSTFTRLAFYLIFPGFFIYHFLVGKGYFTPVLGGYSTSISVLLLPFLCLAYVKHIKQSIQHFSAIEVGFLAFTAYLGLIILINVLLGADAAIAVPLFAITPQFISIFIVAKLVNPVAPGFKQGLMFFYIVLTSIIFLNIFDGVFIASTLDAQSGVDQLADYQGYAFVYIVIALFALTNLRFRWMRVTVYVTAISALFFNGARTEFVGFLVVIPLIEFCLAKHKLRMFVAIGALLLVAFGLQDFLGSMLPENRVLALVTNYQEDGSVSDRIRMMHAAWDTLGNHPFLGSFASYEPGEYAHNALSAWVDVGLIGFIAYLALLAYPMIDLLGRFSSRSQDSEYILTLSIIVLVVLFAITAKHFTYQLFPVAVGLYARFIIVEKRKRAVLLGHTDCAMFP